MPHKAALLMTALNGATSDPAVLSQDAEAIAAATNLTQLVGVFGFSDEQDPVVVVAGEVDGFLPPAILDAVLAGYRGAAAAGTDAVFVNRRRSSGYHVSVSQEQGSPGPDGTGVVAIQVASPKLPS